MIETHKLISFPSNIHKVFETRYLSYKCLKCNHIIFYSIRPQIYWKYSNGLDFGGENQGDNWVEITLSCNEEIVKGLLE